MRKATHQTTREHNTRLVLGIIRGEASATRAEIARRTGLTRSAVSELVAGLMARGWVKELGATPVRVGKPPIHLALDESSRLVLCLDLSGRDFTGGLADLKGNLLHRESLPARGLRGEAAVAAALTLRRLLQERAPKPLLAVSVASPGRVDSDHGVVIQALQREWCGLDLRGRLSDGTGLPLHVHNDAHAATVAEAAYGGHGDRPSLVLVKIGEGIGSGICLRGELHTGEGFSAGEVGHLAFDGGGELCLCGNRGCLETTASLPAMLKAYQARLGGRPATLDLLRSRCSLGEAAARAVVREAGARLGLVVAGMVGLMNVRRIVLSGPLVVLGETLLSAIRAELRSRVLPQQAEETCLQFSTLGPEATLRGAAALALERELDLLPFASEGPFGSHRRGVAP